MSFSSAGFRAVIVGLTAAAMGGVALFARARNRETKAPAAEARPAARAHFVGSEACAACHAREYRAWASSHHRHAMEPADGSSVLGDFGDVTFRYFGRETRFSRRGSSFYVTTENLLGNAETFQVAYTLGYAPLQQYLVVLEGGRIQALPFAWDARPRAAGGQRWFHLYADTNVTPSHRLFWMRPQQNWNHMCGDCHTTGFRKGFSDADGHFESQWSELGNGCESCHGAGSAHVERARQGADSQPRPVLLAGLHTQAEQLDQCGVCHARRIRLRETSSQEHMHETWRPELLRDGLYFVDGQIKDEVFELGSFLQSKMAARGVACSHCHDPHSARLRAQGNALCTQCHDRKTFDGPVHHFHAEGSEGSRCVSCHMPSRTYMVVHERRDHRIAVPRPDLSATLGTPNACATCHQDRGNAWATDAIARHRSGRRLGPSAAERLGPLLWSVRHDQEGATAAARTFLDDPTVGGLAKATALSTLRAVASDNATLVGRPFLKAADPWLRLGAVEALGGAAEAAGAPSLATLADDPSRAVRLALASAVVRADGGGVAPASSADVRSLLDEYEGWLMANADRAEALVEMANLRRAEGDHEGARATFERALRRDETSLVAALNFSAFLLGEGDDGSAETLLRRACDLEPASAEAHFALGMALIRRKEVGAGVRELGKASELAPDNGPYTYAYAVGLHAMAEDERALATLVSARRRFPGNAQIEGALRALCETLHRNPRCSR